MHYREDKYGNKLSILGFGCMRFQRKAGRIDMEEMEKVYNIGRGLININTYPSSIKVSDDCSALFHQIGVQFQVSGASLYWSYRSFSGYLPWTKEAEERIIAASPKEFKDIIDLLN